MESNPISGQIFYLIPDGKNYLKRKREEFDTEAEPLPKLKAACLEPSPLGSFEVLPFELITSIFSLLDRPELLKMKLLNRRWLEITRKEDVYNRGQDLRNLQKLIKYINDYVANQFSVTEKNIAELNQEVDPENQKALNFGLKKFLGSMHYKLIRRLRNVEFEVLINLNVNSLSLPSGFENFHNILLLISLSKKIKAHPYFINDIDISDDDSDDETDTKINLAHETLGIGEIQAVYNYGEELKKNIEDKKFNNIFSQFQNVLSVFRVESTEKWNPKVSEDEYLALNIEADIFYILIHFKQFKLAERLLRKVVFHHIFEAEDYHYKRYIASFELLVSSGEIENCINLIRLIKFFNLRKGVIKAITKELISNDKVEDAVRIILEGAKADPYRLIDLFKLELSSNQYQRALQSIYSVFFSEDDELKPEYRRSYNEIFEFSIRK